MEKASGEEIRRFIVEQVAANPISIVRVTAERFGLTRQAVHRHLRALVDEGAIKATGRTRQREYSLKVQDFRETLSLAENRDEDRVWRMYVEPHLAGLPTNVLRICQYGFTEMFNNAIDHSEGSQADVTVGRSAACVSLWIEDNGVGIFRKIRSKFGLEDERHAMLELAKGKLTTDPARHWGGGIFLTSRMFDMFSILSGKLFVGHEDGDDWLLEASENWPGTNFLMRISTNSQRTTKEVFDRYANPDLDDYGFSRTHIPLTLAQYGQDQLVSRSQARRVLERVERFREVCLDFSGVEFIGQAFADEIFRVFALAHPQVKFVAIGANEDVNRMIGRALAAARSAGGETSAAT